MCKFAMKLVMLLFEIAGRPPKILDQFLVRLFLDDGTQALDRKAPSWRAEEYQTIDGVENGFVFIASTRHLD
jgi:hypothetical protein